MQSFQNMKLYPIYHSAYTLLSFVWPFIVYPNAFTRLFTNPLSLCVLVCMRQQHFIKQFKFIYASSSISIVVFIDCNKCGFIISLSLSLSLLSDYWCLYIY